MRNKRKSRLNKRAKRLKKYGNCCYLCGKQLSANSQKIDRGFTFDHVLAKSKGGGRGENLKPCCKACNERKGKMDIIVLAKGTIIKVNGLPFRLVEETRVMGESENMSPLDKITDDKLIRKEKSHD